jgi:hypothetical protein
MSQEDVIMSWEVPEYDKYERSKRWYIYASIVCLGVLVYSFFSSNFLFAVIIVLITIVVIMDDARQPDQVGFAIMEEGVSIGKKFIDYDELKNFSIIYKPRQGVKKLYFEFNNIFRPRLSINIDDANPLKIRDNLLNYLQEDLERDGEPLSEALGKTFKI